ncbi:RIB43A-like with coiled-coils protein 2 isoform X2 [Ambystoma mexicanum]
MYKLDLPLDLKEVAAIERRRNREQQRQSRIFNAKVRTIGVDVEVLKCQVAERKLAENKEKAREESFDADRVQSDKVAQILEVEQDCFARSLNKKVQEFREQMQAPDTRREFDLYDPDALKKDKPARVSDDDPRCGPASLQKLGGEDLNKQAREKLQEELTKKWLTEQRQERERLQTQSKYADNLCDKKRVELDERALHLARMEEDCRKAIDLATENFNKAQAAEVAERRRLEKQQEEDDNFAEIYNHLTGDILTENPDQAISWFGPQRVVSDRWKGMSPEQLEAIRHTQELQRQENERLKEQARQLDAEWDKQRNLAARAGMFLEEEECSVRKHLRKGLDSYNQQLAREQKAHLQYLEKEVYTNNPTAQYHCQFNTTSR